MNEHKIDIVALSAAKKRAKEKHILVNSGVVKDVRATSEVGIPEQQKYEQNIENRKRY